MEYIEEIKTENNNNNNNNNKTESGVNEDKLKDIEIYEGLKVSDLLKKIYKNTEEKNEQIRDLVEKLSGFIKNLEDATLISTIIKDYLSILVKNDNQFIEMGKLVEKMAYNKSKKNQENVDSAEDLLDDNEKRELYLKYMKDVDSNKKETDKEIKNVDNNIKFNKNITKEIIN
jgi:hypothetical protein